MASPAGRDSDLRLSVGASRAAVVRSLRSLLVFAVLPAAMWGCGEQVEVDPADVTVLTGPRFWTGDPGRPWADGLLVSRGRIARVLSREDVAAEAAAGVMIRSLAGRVATPGLVDAHAHIRGYGLARGRLDLVGTASLEEVLGRVSERASRDGSPGWILGRGWDQNDWQERRWPNADELERAAPGRPCLLTRIDGHAVWVNRTALSLAGVDESTPDPDGGAILRDAGGLPTGILVDAAIALVEGIVPPPAPKQVERALELAAKEFIALGLTGVHDMGVSAATWEAMVRLQEEGRFPLRVHAYADAGSELHRSLLESGPREAGSLRLVGVKLYADGALGSRGARLLEPYSDAPAERGLWVTQPGELRDEVEQLAAAGLQPAVHAIGDAAVRAVLDTYEQSARAAPRLRELRPRVEHAQVVSAADLSRFAEIGAIASMQPTHATSDMPWAQDRLGPRRVAGAYAWRSLLDRGASIAFGSDAPVESADPRLGLYAASTRQDLRGRPEGGWMPGERLTALEALAGFTSGAANALGRDAELGRLVPGALCDLTVFDGDPTSVPPARLQRLTITATVVGGRVVYPGPGD